MISHGDMVFWHNEPLPRTRSVWRYHSSWCMLTSKPSSPLWSYLWVVTIVLDLKLTNAGVSCKGCFQGLRLKPFVQDLEGFLLFIYCLVNISLPHLREDYLYHIRWIFGKLPNGLWPPPPHTHPMFGKLCCAFFREVLKSATEFFGLE